MIRSATGRSSARQHPPPNRTGRSRRFAQRTCPAPSDDAPSHRMPDLERPRRPCQCREAGVVSCCLNWSMRDALGSYGRSTGSSSFRPFVTQTTGRDPAGVRITVGSVCRYPVACRVEDRPAAVCARRGKRGFECLSCRLVVGAVAAGLAGRARRSWAAGTGEELAALEAAARDHTNGMSWWGGS
jgi:hypothetical protein